MNIQTIVKVISAVFGLLGVVFLFRIIGVGDEEIKMAASMGRLWSSISFSFLIYSDSCNHCYCNCFIFSSKPSF